jgi:hypothetical protein
LTNNNNGDSLDGLDPDWVVPKRCGPKCRELRVDSLSSEEWNYLRGLFLADGCSFIKPHERNYYVRFFLQKDEVELARRVVEMTRRAGLNPHVHAELRKNMVTVTVLSKSLLTFLPSKRRLLVDEAERVRFFEGNGLHGVKCGIPFLAGLLDGDGACWVYIQRHRFECLNRWNWNFAQHKYGFLVDYVNQFVEHLAEGGVAERVRSDGVVELRFRKAGIVALLNERISDYSWKVARWLEKCDAFRSGRAKYCTARDVARMFGVSQNFVIKRWLKGGKMRYERGSVRGSEARTCYFIDFDEVERFRARFNESNERPTRDKKEQRKGSKAGVGHPTPKKRNTLPEL